jgi:two-component system, sensor histidine kinase
MLLKLSGDQCRATYDGQAAFDASAVCEPHLAIIDIGMPGINGYALAGRLRQQANHSAVLVALRGWSQERDRQRAMTAEFDHFFIKPVELDDLLRIIDASDC